jgi:hypothetical protein
VRAALDRALGTAEDLRRLDHGQVAQEPQDHRDPLPLGQPVQGLVYDEPVVDVAGARLDRRVGYVGVQQNR